MLQASILRHFRRLKLTEGVSATLTRGAVTTTPTIVLGRTDSQALTNREATFSADSQDILVEAAEYIGEPQDGDSIAWDEEGQLVTAEARPPTGTERCFSRWKGGQVYRVHCKVISREDN